MGPLLSERERPMLRGGQSCGRVVGDKVDCLLSVCATRDSLRRIGRPFIQPNETGESSVETCGWQRLKTPGKSSTSRGVELLLCEGQSAASTLRVALHCARLHRAPLH